MAQSQISSLPSSEIVIYGHRPVTLPLKIHETLILLAFLPMQNYSGGDSVELSMAPPPSPPTPAPPIPAGNCPYTARRVNKSHDNNVNTVEALF